MTRYSIAIPVNAVATLSFPDLSLVDGTPDAKPVAVHSLDGSLLRRAISVRIPLDRTSAAKALRAERLHRIRNYASRPAMTLASLAFLAVHFVYFVVKNSSGGYPWWIFLPLVAAALIDERIRLTISRIALEQHPRREKRGIRISGVPEPVAQEIVRLNPGTSIVD